MYQNHVKELELEWTRIIPKAVIAHYIPPASTSVMSSLSQLIYVICINTFYVQISVFNTYK